MVLSGTFRLFAVERKLTNSSSGVKDGSGGAVKCPPPKKKGWDVGRRGALPVGCSSCHTRNALPPPPPSPLFPSAEMDPFHLNHSLFALVFHLFCAA